MNNSIIRRCGMFFVGVLFLISSETDARNGVSFEVCSHHNDLSEDIKERIDNLSSVVDMRLTPEVMSYINGYLEHPEGTSKIIGRQMSFFPIFEGVLIQKSLPTDLKYLTVVESGLQPSATSRVGAAGFWQLMRTTGRMLGLKINRVVDERRNPYRSTEAATDYLRMLYDEFQDWTLVLAAYNSGPGRVRSAIRRSGSKDYWELRKYLPKETRNYVPAYIAVTYLSTYYYLHEISPILEHADMMSLSNIQVYDEISFKEIENVTGTSIEMIKTLNPGYLRSYIPSSALGNHLLLPNYAATLLLHHYYRPDKELEYIMPSNMDNRLVTHTGELVLRERIQEIDLLPIVDDRQIIFADKLPIAPFQAQAAATRNDETQWVRLGKRESLKDVSERYNIPLSDLLSLNEDWTGESRRVRLR